MDIHFIKTEKKKKNLNDQLKSKYKKCKNYTYMWCILGGKILKKSDIYYYKWVKCLVNL